MSKRSENDIFSLIPELSGLEDENGGFDPNNSILPFTDGNQSQPLGIPALYVPEGKKEPVRSGAITEFDKSDASSISYVVDFEGPKLPEYREETVRAARTVLGGAGLHAQRTGIKRDTLVGFHLSKKPDRSAEAEMFFESVLNGTLFADYPDKTLGEYAAMRVDLMGDFEKIMKQRFFDKYADGDAIVPWDEFTPALEKKKRKINNLFNYLLTCVRIRDLTDLYRELECSRKKMAVSVNDLDVAEYSERLKEFRAIVCCENFRPLLRNFALVYHGSYLNESGYEKLTKLYSLLEQRYERGFFDEQGQALLRNVERLIEPNSRYLYRNFSLRESLGEEFQALENVFRRLVKNNWNYSGDDLRCLIKFYTDFKKFYNENKEEDSSLRVFNSEIVEPLERAVRLHRRPILVKHTLLLAEDLDRLNMARAILRTTVGSLGGMNNKDIETLRDTADYLEELMTAEKGLLSGKEVNLIKIVYSGIRRLLDFKSIIQGEFKEDDRDVMMKVAEMADKISEDHKKRGIAMRSSGDGGSDKAYLFQQLRAQKETFFSINIMPTQLLTSLREEDLANPDKKRKREILGQDLSPIERVFKACEHIRSLANFDRRYDVVFDFWKKLYRVESAELKADRLTFLQKVGNFAFFPERRLSSFMENDLELIYLTLTAKRLSDLERSTGKEIEPALLYEEYLKIKRNLGMMVLHVGLVLEALRLHISAGDSRSGEKRIYEMCDFMLDKHNEAMSVDKLGNISEFARFFEEARFLSSLDTLFGIAKDSYGLTVSQLPPRLLERVKYFIRKVQDFAGDNVKKRYLLDEFQLNHLGRAFELCKQLRSFLPRVIDERVEIFFEKALIKFAGE